MSDSSEKIKICRNCRTIYKNLTQKFCGNGCELKPPYYFDGKTNSEIIPREVILSKTDPLKIRWVCNQCKKEFSQEDLEKRDFICDCGSKNDFYPFTEKFCGNSDCKSDGLYRKLPLEAKVCDLCAKSDFFYNHSIFKSELKPSLLIQDECWEGPIPYNFYQEFEEKEKDTSLLSCKITILNNNVEYLLYGENKLITVKNLIKDAKAYMPEEIYEELLNTYGDSTPLFTIIYNSQNESFSMSTIFQGEFAELDARYFQNKINKFNKQEQIPLKENILTQIHAGFFKIHVWIY